jgi:hypothetical protein
MPAARDDEPTKHSAHPRAFAEIALQARPAFSATAGSRVTSAATRGRLHPTSTSM